jgi:PBP1b-binding outer membrane lipoprotein LpoB
MKLLPIISLLVLFISSCLSKEANKNNEEIDVENKFQHTVHYEFRLALIDGVD